MAIISLCIESGLFARQPSVNSLVSAEARSMATVLLLQQDCFDLGLDLDLPSLRAMSAGLLEAPQASLPDFKVTQPLKPGR